jgi:hypothetical protein
MHEPATARPARADLRRRARVVVAVALIPAAASFTGGCATFQAGTDPKDRVVIVPARELPADTIDPEAPFTVVVTQLTRDGEDGVLEQRHLQSYRTAAGEIAKGLLGAAVIGSSIATGKPPPPGSEQFVASLFVLPLTAQLPRWVRERGVQLRQVFLAYPLADEIRSQLAMRAPGPDAQPWPDAPQVRLDVLDIGLMAADLEESRPDTCVAASAMLSVSAGHRIVFEDVIVLEPFLRSADAGTPACIAVGEFAALDADLLRKAIAEYGRLFAAIAVARLDRLPWGPATEAPAAGRRGNVRRLLLLPPAFRSEGCPAIPSDEVLRAELREITRRFLADWRGYDVAEPEDAGKASLAALAQRIGASQTRADGVVPDADRAEMLAVAGRAGAEGVLVVHGELHCITPLDLIGAMLFVGIPNLTAKQRNTAFSVGVYDARSGNPLGRWRLEKLVHPGEEILGRGPKTWLDRTLRAIPRVPPELIAR